ncbi:MAG: serine hydrolase [Planctomycetota bacterium]
MHRLLRFVWILFAITLVSELSAEETEFDVVLRGGRVVDGTGAPWYRADVGVRDGLIAKIGRISEGAGETELDARGLVVAPGFVDMMGQTATPMIDDPQTAMNLLTQGITTINAGEGASAAPLSEADGLRRGWTTFAEYFQLLDLRGLPVNVVQTVGHTQVRRLVLGSKDRRPNAEELERMKSLVREAMEAGAIGLSTALIYPPAVYANTDEIAALASVAGEHGGRYYTHMRNEGDRLIEAIDEAMTIGRKGNAPVHIFHLKAAGEANWGKMELALASIKAARSQGQQVTADIYPYVNNGLGIRALIHPRHFADGHDALIARLDSAELRAEIRREMESVEGWENWFRHAGKDWKRIVVGRSNVERYDGLDGQSVAAIAARHREDPWDTFFTLVRAGAFALPETMSDANKIRAMREPFVSFCTDVGPAAGGRSASHPRAFGSFPRLFARYVRELGAISLERAVAQASAAASNAVLAFDRGRIAEGLAADIIAFDYEKFRDYASFANPSRPATGMRYVLVNGRLVLRDGIFTGARPGRVLRGPGFRAESAPWNVASDEGDERFESYDREISAFLSEHRTPGASIAVGHRGKVAFARGYGYADLAKREPVNPASLFRIASISKPITAVAILQLVEREKLTLDARWLEVLDHSKEIEEAGDAFDPRLRNITIRHLLQHRSGWDRRVSFDAMFKAVDFAKELGVPAPAGPSDVMRAMLRRKLDFDPGHRYAYSNLGYCILGRVIEKVTGVPYEDYVRKEVLAPIGVTAMRCGQTALAHRAYNEVRYYHPLRGPSVFQANLGVDVPSPYGAWHLEAMDAHGAWIASATDLTKFASAFDDPDNSPLLSRASIEEMYRRPPGLAGHNEDGSPKERYYSLGWSNRVVEGGINRWHSGSLPGTATILIRRHDGKNFCALLNARVSPSSAHLGLSNDKLLHRATNAVTEWPAEGSSPTD